MHMHDTTTTMPGMPMSTSTSPMDMSTMQMTFFTSTTTPLFSLSWTPATAGQYTGTCLFLITLAFLFRAILAIRVNLVSISNALTYTYHSKPAIVSTYENEGFRPRPWRAKEAVQIATMDVLLAGVAYLLMIAVMTMNVGYFLSVLAGIFLGGMVFGRFMAYSAGH